MMSERLTAEEFTESLNAHAEPERAGHSQSFFKTGPGQYGEGDVFIGVRMGDLTALARQFKAMSLDQIEKLLDSPVHEVRMGGLKIMTLQAQGKRTTEAHRRALFELYLRRHDAINNWDLVDVSCKWIIGAYLADKPRDVLYDLAGSDNPWERRTAMVSTSYFIGQGDLDDAFCIAEVLLGDAHDLIHKAVGWMLREAGRHDRDRLRGFLDRYAATMPRTALRYSLEHFDAEERAHYMGLKAAAQH
jgi:3-methyladenine DNA glycosylase AlkD